MKYSDAPFAIDKKYSQTPRERAETFRLVTGTRKSLFQTLIAVPGVAPGMYASGLAASQVKVTRYLDDAGPAGERRGPHLHAFYPVHEAPAAWSGVATA